MAVRIRLARAGAKKHPYYHVVAAEVTSPRDGKFIEAFGCYDPTRKPVRLEIDRARLEHWMKCGAQPTVTVSHLIRKLRKAETVKA